EDALRDGHVTGFQTCALPISAPRLLVQQSSAPQSLQPSPPQFVHNQMAATSDRYLELVVVSPDGNEIERYRLSDEALVDLRGLRSEERRVGKECGERWVPERG